MSEIKSPNKNYWTYVISILGTLAAMGFAFTQWHSSEMDAAYKAGQESKEQEINTIARQAVNDRIDKVIEDFQSEIQRVEKKEDEKHKSLEEKIEKGDEVVSEKVDEAKVFALAEIGGLRADMERAISWLKELFEVKISKKADR